MSTHDQGETVYSAVLQLIAKRPLDYEAVIDALAARFTRDAIEGAMFDLTREGQLQEHGGVLRPSRRREDRAPSGTSERWEYQLLEAPLLAQLLGKLNAAGAEGWELVTVTLEGRGSFAPQQHTALLKRRQSAD